MLQGPYFVKDTCVYIQDYKRPLERLGTVCMEAGAAGSTVASRRRARGAREHGGRVAQCSGEQRQIFEAVRGRLCKGRFHSLWRTKEKK